MADLFHDHLTLVYVIAPDANGPSKIGYTRNIKARLADIQIGSWLPLKVYGVRYAVMRSRGNGTSLRDVAKEGAVNLERECHKNLKDCGVHLSGEWFDVSPKEALKALQVTAKKSSIAIAAIEDVAGVEVEISNGLEEDAYNHLMGALVQANEFIASQVDAK